MGFKRYDGCISCVLFQISWHLQTQIIKNRILSDSLMGNKLYLYYFSAYLWFFFKKQWFNILHLKLYCYIFCKFMGLYEHQQETKVPFLAIFDNFSWKLSEINLN